MIEEVADGVAFAEALTRGEFDVVIADRRLHWGDGLRAVEAVKAFFPERPVMLLTRELEPELVSRAVALGLDAVLEKSAAGYRRLPDTVEELLARREVGGAQNLAQRRLAENLPVGVFSVSATSGVTRANPATARILGLPDPTALWGEKLEPFLAEPADRTRLRRALAEGEELAGLEVRLARRDGQRGWGRLSVWPLPPERQSPGILDGTLEDISAYKLTADALARRADDLDRTNAELQGFAHVVSHDLQAPLTRIDRYAELLADHAGAKLDRVGRGHLEQLARAARQMHEMLGAILEYSRVETRGEPLERVSLDTVLDEACELLRGEIDAAGGRVTHDPLPAVAADRAQMLLLLQNLVGNAVKFRNERPPAVHVSADESADGWEIRVADNGVGIAPDDRQRIFGMFERLQPQAEVPGSGVGLAICKRIVERHGGDIRVDSEPGEGSTFIVHMPHPERWETPP